MTKLILLITTLLTLSACSSKEKKAQDLDQPVVQDLSYDMSQYDESMSQRDEASSWQIGSTSDSMNAGELQTVFFPFDSSELAPQTQQALQANAQFLKDHPEVQVQIEGHCDERGDLQYNMALGEKRAQEVKNYLIALGVSTDRMSTISFGKELPLVNGHNESAWSKNRRANFSISAK